MSCVHARVAEAGATSASAGAAELANFCWRSPDRQWTVRPIQWAPDPFLCSTFLPFSSG